MGAGSSLYPASGVGQVSGVNGAGQPWQPQQPSSSLGQQESVAGFNQMIMVMMMSIMAMAVELLSQPSAVGSTSAPGGVSGMGAASPSQVPPLPASASNLTIKGKQASAEQLQNARIIAEVGRSLGATQQEISVAIATAIQESNLQNLTGGDRDSLGLFQQRPSMEWGSREQISDPRFAAESFFKGRGSNVGLLSTRNIADPFLRSHRVQRSAHPDAPKQWAQEGTALAQVVV
jgi:hypothetical protein